MYTQPLFLFTVSSASSVRPQDPLLFWRWVVGLCCILTLEHHAAGAHFSFRILTIRFCWVPKHWVLRVYPISFAYTIQTGYRTISEPPTATRTVGAVHGRRIVVVFIICGELHPVWPPIGVIVEGVTSVFTVPDHLQSVLIGLRCNGHTLVLSPQPLTSWCYLHFHAQTTT